MKKYIKINEKDNVVVALTDLIQGEVILVDEKIITLKKEVKRGHKVAIEDITKNTNIIKYGFPIGHSIKNISQGENVHINSVKTNLDTVTQYVFNQHLNKNPFKNRNLTFMGYNREDGNVGIRNEIWIVPMVGCVNGIADKIIERFKESVVELLTDSVQVFKHNYGCSQLGEDHQNTRDILKSVVKHPNAGGVLVLGLGCENNTITDFKTSLGKFNENRVKFLVAQEVSDEIEEGALLLKALYENMKNDKREIVSLSKLKIGLKCGGSDGLSGITANPLLGKFSDFLIAQGGATVLTEVPEMFGAEILLMDRAKNVGSI